MFACPCVYILPLLMMFRLTSLVYGKKHEVQLRTDLPEEVKLTCTQFIKYHKAQCCEDIVKKRW